jgi:hypothetical protein
MMYGHGKSRPVIVARKPANKAARSATEPSVKEPAAAESVEPRAGAKGNADWQSTRRTQRRVSVSQALERIRQVGARLLCRLYPRWEPYAGKSHVRNCAGGARQLASLPRPVPFVAVHESAAGPSGGSRQCSEITAVRGQPDVRLPRPILPWRTRSR